MLKIGMTKEMGLCYNITGSGMFIAAIEPFLRSPEGTTIRSVFGGVALTGAIIALLGLWPPFNEITRRVGKWVSRASSPHTSSEESLSGDC